MAETVYKDFKREEMEYQFNPRTTVTEYPQLAVEREKASEVTRAKLKHHRDVRYGDAPRMLLDIFPAERAGAPVQVYIHGGYWRGGSKDAYSFISEPFVEAGATMVLLEYDLCPQVTVPDIMRETQEGIAWVYRHIADYGGDPERLYLSGSSAGGHLTARALSHRWEDDGLPEDLIKGAVAITGVYDADPVFYVSSNEDIRLTPDTAREISAMLHPPLDRTPFVVAVGGAETPRVDRHVQGLLRPVPGARPGLLLPGGAGDAPLLGFRPTGREGQPDGSHRVVADGSADGRPLVAAGPATASNRPHAHEPPT